VSDSPLMPPTTAPPVQTASPQALPGDPLPERRSPIGALIVATIGWVLALIAVLILSWPIDGAQPTVSGPHLMRITSSIVGESTVQAIVRHLVDISIYVVLLVGTGLLLAGWIRGSRGAIRGLAVAALLGILYTAGLSLYTSPMIAMCGFVITMVSALVGVTAIQNPSPSAETRSASEPPDHLDKGHDDATYSPA